MGSVVCDSNRSYRDTLAYAYGTIRFTYPTYIWGVWCVIPIAVTETYRHMPMVLLGLLTLHIFGECGV